MTRRDPRAWEIDEDAIEKAATGNSEAKARLLVDSLPHIKDLALLYLKLARTPYTYAEEVVQQTSAAILERLVRCPSLTVEAYKQLVHNIVRQQVRMLTNDRAMRAHWEDSKRLENTTLLLEASSRRTVALDDLASGSSPSQCAKRSERYEFLLEAIRNLSPSEREIIIMTFFEHLSTSEIATRLSIPRATAAMRVLRTIRHLRTKMAETSSASDA